jgi:OOP family OmpA-OmpF porin
MRPTSLAVASALLAFCLGGCASLRENPNACKIAAGALGGALGATGGGLGVAKIEKDPDNGEIAGGATAGAVAGTLIGLLVGHFVCEPPPKPAPPPPPPPPPAPRKIETLLGPHFDFDKATLKPTGKEKVERAVKVLQESPNLRVRVEGYTDSIGTEAYNQKLSERRANAVRDYMIEQGISPSRITAVGYGESNPVASNATAEGRAHNRRVEIIAE